MSGAGSERAGREWLAACLSHHRLLRLPDTPFTARLPRFQRDAAVRLLDVLDREGGALFCDEVGLGKTHVAAAVVDSRPRWRPALVVAPAAVLPEWERLLGYLPGVVLTSYSRLARGAWTDLKPALLVADEAHRLRNAATRRHAAVARLGARARVLLVTATPVHNARREVANLLALLQADRLGLDGRPDTLAAWLSERTVRRSRWTIARIYPAEQRRIGERALAFPLRRGGIVKAALHPRLLRLIAEMPALARAALPSTTDPALSGLLASLLLQRLESSPAALVATLRRLLNYLDRALEAAALGRRLSRRGFRHLFGDHPESQAAQLVLPFLFAGADPPVPAEALRAARSRLQAAVGPLEAADWSADPKRLALVRLLSQGGYAGPTVVMTRYEDTARYLYRGLGPGVVLLTGAGAWARPGGRLDRRDVLAAFGPTPGAAAAALAARCPILVATDVLGEGVNLQGAQRLVHYDRPWNPMAVEQRAGRIDRLFSRHERVEVVTFEVPRRVERRLGLERRLSRKAALCEEVLGGQAGEPGRDPVGLDRDGLLVALAARLGLGARDGQAGAAPCDVPHVAPAEGAGRGWLLALEWAGRVEIVEVHGRRRPRARLAFESLLALAGCEEALADPSDGPSARIEAKAGPADPGRPDLFLDAPTARQQESAVRLLRARIEAACWADVEPVPVHREAGVLRAEALAAARHAAAAYRLGDRGRLADLEARLDGLRGRRRVAATQPIRIIGWLPL